VSFRVRFGIGNLISDVVGTVGSCARKTPVTLQLSASWIDGELVCRRLGCGGVDLSASCL